ncbi:hypothetical protein FIBSPDRAFT_848518 [Athelia psychrophila]|uniref:Uncharacterized protein n=1 Tax=Athelia psychrophila TaxID=1759441 RepID=A0A166UYM4_9AGAM|nr:hypothetical protein FIBSPDRAFT_848518 [Fibularhizoctonia sp. CBS 109695]
MTVHHPHRCGPQRRSSQVPTSPHHKPPHCTTARAPSSAGEREHTRRSNHNIHIQLVP